MKIKNYIDSLKVFERFATLKISSKLAYKIMKISKAIVEEKEFYDVRYNELIQLYGIKKPNGQLDIDSNGLIKIMPDQIEEANQKLQELNNIEVEISNIKFTLEELSELQLSVEEMFYLDPFIVEE